MRQRLLALIAFAFALLPATAAAACPTGDIDEALENAPSVFVGEVAATSDRDRVAEMNVLSVWKGLDLPETVTVAGTFTEGGPVGADDARFTVGRTYLVVPENTRRPFVATKCSATTPINVTGTLIPAPYQQAIGAETGRTPLSPTLGDSTDGGTDGTMAIGLAATGIAASAMGLIATRRRGPERETMVKAPVEHTQEPESAPTRIRRFSAVGLFSRSFTHSGMKRAEHNRRKSRRLRARVSR